MKNVKAAIKLATLVVYSNGLYEVEVWCPVDEALEKLNSAIEDLADNGNADELREHARELGHE